MLNLRLDLFDEKNSRFYRLSQIDNVDSLLYDVSSEDSANEYETNSPKKHNYSRKVNPKNALRANINNKIFKGIDKKGRHKRTSHAPVLRKAIHDRISFYDNQAQNF